MRKNFTLCILVASLFAVAPAMANTYVVTNTADSGPGSLRNAVAQANANPGPDVINFNILVVPTRINLTSSLTITEAVLIDGYSNTGASQGPINARQLMIGLNFSGPLFNLTPRVDGIVINNASDVTVRGVAIYGAARGIVISGGSGSAGSIRIQGITVGSSETNQNLFFIPGSPPTIGEARNFSHGIYLASTAGIGFASPRVFIGTDGDGINDANEGNLITNNTGDGIFVDDADFNVISGNFIGTTQTGGIPGFDESNNNGITLDGNNNGDGSTSNRIGTNGDGTSDLLERNIISANRINGVQMIRRGTNNTIAGNYIGLSLGGNVAGNGNNGGIPQTFITTGNGILLSDVVRNFVGVRPTGGSVAQRNYISGNAQNGVTIYSANNATDTNTVAGNFIGLNESSEDRGNLNWGVFLVNENNAFVNVNIIGSNDDGNNDNIEGNTIWYNDYDGVGLFQQSTGQVRSNRVSRNSFSSNGRLAINLLTSLSDLTTINSPSTAGANQLYNYPVIGSVSIITASNTLVVTGTAPQGAYIQFYIASTDANPDQPTFFEGQTFLFGAQDGDVTDANPALGGYQFTIPLASLPALTPGTAIVAVAFGSPSGGGNTSEFSSAVLSLLPVQFVSFKAELQSDKVLVSWATAQEQNASHFDVERSTNGRDFTKIGQVKAAGNSNVLVNYSFADNNPVLGVSYYRLRQVDIDNRFVYTKTVIIRNEARSNAFSVWPNPVLDNVNVTLQSDKNQNLSLRVVDYNGRVVRSQVVNATRGVNQITVNMSTLTKGMYVIQVIGENLNLTEKVIKQ
jgi:hypothetical protein